MNSENKRRRAVCEGSYGRRAAAAGTAARDTPEVKVPGQSHYRTPRDALFITMGACRQGWRLGSGRTLRAGTARLLACACLIAGAHALVPLPGTAQCRDFSARTWLLRQSGMSGRSPNAFAGRSLHTVLPRRGSRLALRMCEPPPPAGVTVGSSSASSKPLHEAGQGEGDDSKTSGGDVREGDTRFTGAPNLEDGGGSSPFTGEWLAGMLKRNAFLNKWLEDELHEMETSVGYDIPGQGQIVEYDPAFLSKAGWMVNLRGTVFSIPFIYWQFLWLLMFALAYAWAAGPMPAVLDVMGMQGVACTAG